MKKVARDFRAPEAQDFVILEDGKVLGTVRIKPSSIMWKGPNARAWYGISPEKFGEFVTASGKKMKM
jgi:hypothetical protein